MMSSVDGKVAIITGGARGIGAATARKLLGAGARVIITDVLAEQGEETAATMQAEGGDAVFMPHDVTKEDDWRRVVEAARDKFGGLDILVNNAAYNPSNPAERTTVDKYPDEVFVKMMDVDINGTYYCSKYAAQQMIRQQSGRIINIASVAGKVPLRNQIGHVVGKAAVISLTEAMALELGEHGIGVNAIAPGSTVTDATRGIFYNEDGSFNEQGEKLVSFVPNRRPGQIEDIAHAALFLASQMASYINGHTLVVDGGWTCGFMRDF